MPVSNKLFGVWKVLRVKNPVDDTMVSIVVESATEKSEQDISVFKGVLGTALPRVLNIGGGIATIDIVSPLLVGETTRSAAGDLPDGLNLWSMWFNTTVMAGDYEENPGLIMSKASFSCDANGAKYTIQLMGDANSIKSENASITNPWFELQSWGESGPGSVPANEPLPILGGPYRVATFYDIEADLGTEFAGTFIENLTVSMDITTEQFTYVGAPDQRKVIGINGMSLTFSGSLIHDQRMPTGHAFGWQALQDVTNVADGSDPAYMAEGIAKSVTGGLSVYVRDGASPTPGQAISILPKIMDGGLLDDVVFSTSSLAISPGLLKTQFQGQAWINKNSLT